MSSKLVLKPLSTPRHILDASSLCLVSGIGAIVISGLYEVGATQSLLHTCWGITAFSLLAGGVFLLLSKKGGEYQSVFSLCLMVRTLILVAMVMFPPHYQRASVDVPAIFPDEVYYTELAMHWSRYTASEVVPNTRYELISAYQSQIYRTFGTNILWVRLTHLILGCLTSVLIFDCASMTLDKRGRRAAYWLSSIYPGSSLCGQR